jgi:MYXO-CTERM domain-containing protein
LFAQSLWTQTFTYTGTFPIDLTLHLHVPSLQVGLLGVPPRRTSISATETAQAIGRLDRSITHPDLTIEGGHIEFGMREFEQQLPSGADLLNIAMARVIDNTGGQVITQAPSFNGDDFSPSFTLDSFSFDVDLGELHTGDILSYTYTLTAEGTTHGFERGYFAFLGDPFGGEPISDNLSVTITPVNPAGVPEASTWLLMLSGLAAVFAWRRRTRKCLRAS